MGRPPKYETPEQLQEAIDKYFASNISAPTITGLALDLGFESRQSFYDYEKDGEFSYTIKKARLRIESKYEGRLHEAACTGAIFALKNFGWKDKVEQDMNITAGVNINLKPAEGNAPIND